MIGGPPSFDGVQLAVCHERPWNVTTREGGEQVTATVGNKASHDAVKNRSTQSSSGQDAALGRWCVSV